VAQVRVARIIAARITAHRFSRVKIAFLRKFVIVLPTIIDPILMETLNK
jgi:hypothetical protein